MRMIDLFEAAGFKDFKKMKELEPHAPKKDIEVLSFDLETGEQVYKKVNALFFKGMSRGFKVDTGGAQFSVTGDHQFFASTSNGWAMIDGTLKETDQKYSWVPAKDLPEIFYGIDMNGNPVRVDLTPLDEEFPVLDIEVDDTHAYFTGGIFSHNSFGGTAKVFANGLKYINPFLARTDTSMIVINQERANVGCIDKSTEVLWDFLDQ